MANEEIRYMKILIDTNVLIDYSAEREPYFQDARCILLACSENKISGCIAAHSINNIFYILKKADKSSVVPILPSDFVKMLSL